MAYNISTSESIFSYPALSATKDGINYIHDRWIPETSVTYNKTATGSYVETIIKQSPSLYSNDAFVYHVKGTVTRDITDNTEYYSIANPCSLIDDYVYIPVDHHSNVTNVDTVFISTSTYSGHSGFSIEFKTLDNTNTIISTTNEINLVVTRYCL